MFCDGSNIGGDVQALTYREELGDFNNRREFELSWLTLCLDHPLISIAKMGVTIDFWCLGNQSPITVPRRSSLKGKYNLQENEHGVGPQ